MLSARAWTISYRLLEPRLQPTRQLLEVVSFVSYICGLQPESSFSSFPEGLSNRG